jgi:hypothetical protein
MSIRINLTPELEARLEREARAQGLPPEGLAERLLEGALSGPSDPKSLTVESFHQMLDQMAKGSETLPDLPLETFTRESYYEDDPRNGGEPLPRR